jgi:adenylate cyclase
MFAKAVELDPFYARAYAGMADCDTVLNSWFGVEIPTADILATIDRALALDPRLAEAHALRGVALINIACRREAISAFERALVLDPNNYAANYFYARYCFTEGDLNRAVIHFIRALEIQPDDYVSPCLLTGILQSLGRGNESKSYGRLGLKRAEESLKRNPDNFDAAALGANTLAALGEREQAKDWLARALAIENDPSVGWYTIACTYSLLGDAGRAIDLLEIWLPKVGPDQKLWIAKDSDLDPIRNHPRFQKLLELAG